MKKQDSEKCCNFFLGTGMRVVTIFPFGLSFIYTKLLKVFKMFSFSVIKGIFDLYQHAQNM
jgi:hypothetical protein